MEGMNLEKLEAMVEKMLNNLQELRRDNAQLQAQLAAKNSRVAELESEVKAMNSTQDEVSTRVTTLLSSIEEWERTLDPDAQAPQDAEESREGRPEGGGAGTLFPRGQPLQHRRLVLVEQGHPGKWLILSTA